MSWKLEDIGDRSGSVALVTGGNTGLGFRTSLELARRGERVLLACRKAADGEEACDAIRREVAGAEVESVVLDLLDADSIAACAEQVLQRTERLDLLINNAGVVNLPALRRTPDGHEMHMATNHFGHFALTGRLYPLIASSTGARVVTLSSLSYRQGKLDFDDLDWRRRSYSRGGAYGDSKLANLHFMRSLQARFERAGASATSVAAHPGLTGTKRQQTVGIGGALSRWIASPVGQGVQPQLFAATAEGLEGGAFIGPRWGIRGRPHRLTLELDPAIGERLWTVSESVTGVRYPE